MPCACLSLKEALRDGQSNGPISQHKLQEVEISRRRLILLCNASMQTKFPSVPLLRAKATLP